MAFKTCTEEELREFIAAYPRPLETDVAHMYDPPLQTYNDFSDGKVWPESIVAQVVLGSVREGEKDTHSILESVARQDG